MSFNSILFDHTDYLSHTDPGQFQAPDFFTDLNLDQIIDQITSGKEEYNLKPFFYSTLNDLYSISYRHEIMQDLENSVLFACIKSFAQNMLTMRQHLVLDALLTESTIHQTVGRAERWIRLALLQAR